MAMTSETVRVEAQIVKRRPKTEDRPALFEVIFENVRGGSSKWFSAGALHTTERQAFEQVDDLKREDPSSYRRRFRVIEIPPEKS